MKKRWYGPVSGILAGILGALTCSTAAAQPPKHIIIVSIDGLHQADLTDPALRDQFPNILSSAGSGVWYSNASTTYPSDSFPGTLSYLTGAGPATTGVYYDDSYCRSLLPPGSKPDATPGTAIQNTEVLDKNSDLLSGGGDFGRGSLDTTKFPLDPSRNSTPMYPHNYLKVNTILEIIHAAGLRTSLIDKHPAYEIAAGPSGQGIDDLYCPEIQARAVLVDGKLLDSSTAPAGADLKAINKTPELTMAYDDMKVDALVRELHGQDARGQNSAPVPALVVINLQALNVAEKANQGGIDMADGKEVPSQVVLDALKHADDTIGHIEAELKFTGLWDQTLLVILAKHGQDPRLGSANLVPKTAFLKPLEDAGIPVAAATMDDGALIWLKNSLQASDAAKILQSLKQSPADPGILQIIRGDALADAGLAGPADRTPDLIVTLKPGILIADKKRSDHGGNAEDDTHVPLILAGGVLDEKSRGTTISAPVKLTQLAVTTLMALGLDPGALQGAQIEHTAPLPDNGLDHPSATQARYSN